MTRLASMRDVRGRNFGHRGPNCSRKGAPAFHEGAPDDCGGGWDSPSRGPAVLHSKLPVAGGQLATTRRPRKRRRFALFRRLPLEPSPAEEVAGIDVTGF